MKSIIGFLLSVCITQTVWAEQGGIEYTTAIAATESGNYQQALPIWQKLATNGDPVAQYNLGLFYQNGLGTQADKSEASRWFYAAANNGLVQAYNQLNDTGIKPAPNVRIEQALGPQEWVMAQNPKHFTLQLASSRNRSMIEKYLNENNLHGKAGYYRSIRDGREMYALVYGAYATTAEATASISLLPESLRKWKPWVRKLDDIHDIVLRDSARTNF